MEGGRGGPWEFSDNTDLHQVHPQHGQKLWFDAAIGWLTGATEWILSVVAMQAGIIGLQSDRSGDGCWQINPWREDMWRDLRWAEILGLILKKRKEKEMPWCTREAVDQKKKKLLARSSSWSQPDEGAPESLADKNDEIYRHREDAALWRISRASIIKGYCLCFSFVLTTAAISNYVATARCNTWETSSAPVSSLEPVSVSTSAQSSAQHVI